MYASTYVCKYTNTRLSMADVYRHIYKYVYRHIYIYVYVDTFTNMMCIDAYTNMVMTHIQICLMFVNTYTHMADVFRHIYKYVYTCIYEHVYR